MAILYTCTIQGVISRESHEVDFVVDGTKHGAGNVSRFEAVFFDRYQPNTVLDMVDQLPGFRIDDGGAQRGFGNSAGNILIDGRRPTAKQDGPSDILDRIPADNVAYIEIIRGSASDIELKGQDEVVNVVLASDTPASVRWEIEMGKKLDSGRIPLKGNVSVTDQWQAVEYNLGLEYDRFVRPDKGTDKTLDAFGNPLSANADSKIVTGTQYTGNINGVTSFLDTQVYFNSEMGYRQSNDSFISNYGGPAQSSAKPEIVQNDDRDRLLFEFGIDFTTELAPDLAADLIILYAREDENSFDNQQRFAPSGVHTRTRTKDVNTVESESILRSVFEWTGWDDHSPQLSIEFAYNYLDNSETEIRDTGSGPETVLVPGANTRIEETRGNFLINESWELEKLELDYGLGAEVSRIKQTGDENLTRDFFYMKPYAMLNYSLDESRQASLRVERKIGQLDFDDFVSATVFEDNEINLGNPNLEPETSWNGQLTLQQRVGEIGIIKLTAFHDWISDVQDLLPLTTTEEVAGNIGRGKRWGLILESTLPLDWAGMDNSRLDVELYWQDSTVTDPVTGDSRQLSSSGGGYYNGNPYENDVEYDVKVDFRQDILKSNMAWGWNLSFNADRKRFKVNELETNDDGVNLDFFVETSRWLGLKIRAEAKNLLDSAETRDRLYYAGFRSLSPLNNREQRQYYQGREFTLTLTGSF